MKMTLLQMVQSILNDIDGDEVNSIDDSIESSQCADIVKSSFFDIIGRRDWPHLKQMVQMDDSLDLSRPNYLAIPENTKEMIWITYEKHREGDNRLLYRPVKFLWPDEFIYYTNQRNTTDDNIDAIVDFSGTTTLIRNDMPPQFWTSFDDRWLVFDSYDSAVDSTLQASKCQVYAVISPTWENRDDFVPFLPVEAFPLLLEESKSMAFINLKQMVNEKAEARARKQDSWLSRKAFTLAGGVRYPDYGRRGKGSGPYRPQPLEKYDPTPTTTP